MLEWFIIRSKILTVKEKIIQKNTMRNIFITKLKHDTNYMLQKHNILR